MSSLIEKGHTQLGKWVTHQYSDQDKYSYLHTQLSTKLNNLDSALIPGEL